MWSYNYVGETIRNVVTQWRELEDIETIQTIVLIGKRLFKLELTIDNEKI